MRWHSGFCSKTTRLESEQQGSHAPWTSERHPTQAQMGKRRCFFFLSSPYIYLFIYLFRDMQVGHRGAGGWGAGWLVTWRPLALHVQCKTCIMWGSKGGVFVACERFMKLLLRLMGRNGKRWPCYCSQWRGCTTRTTSYACVCAI